MKHRAHVVGVTRSGARVEGEYFEAPVEGPTFACVFFPPGPRETGRAGRRNEQPGILHLGVDLEGEPLRLKPTDMLSLDTTPGLDEESAGIWQIDGDDVPLGKPGRKPKCWAVGLKRVSGPAAGA